jgi:hypothetical protein
VLHFRQATGALIFLLLTKISGFLLLLSFFLLSSFVEEGPQIHFEETKHNFGFVHQGDILEYDYVFSNTGNAPLIITETKTECTCTTAEKPYVAILPGQKGKIHLRFDSKSAMDRQHRTIEVSSNATDLPLKLVFKCIVLKKK